MLHKHRAAWDGPATELARCSCTSTAARWSPAALHYWGTGCWLQHDGNRSSSQELLLRDKALQLGGDDGLQELPVRLDFNAALLSGSKGWAGH